MLKLIVRVAEIVAVLSAIAFVVLLFTRQPATVTVAADADGATIYAANCATCHGDQGQGGYGPKLGGGAVKANYPDNADQIAVIADGRNLMPSWSSKLTADQIEAVALYTREDLSG
jgi:mono/diheme cytochrome c family protein